MNTMFLKSDLQEIATIVARLKQAESAAEKWAAKDDTVTDKYAYKYGAMIGQVNSVVYALEVRLGLLERSLEMGITKIAEKKPLSIQFLETSGYYESVLSDVKYAGSYDDAILALTDWFNDLDRDFELGSDYRALKDHAVQALSYFNTNGLI